MSWGIKERRKCSFSASEILKGAFPQGNLPPLKTVEVGTGGFPYKESIFCAALLCLEKRKKEKRSTDICLPYLTIWARIIRAFESVRYHELFMHAKGMWKKQTTGKVGYKLGST